jgi:hypothetical protein
VYPEPECDAHCNEGGRAFEPWAPDALNPRYFQEAERRIAYANAHGLTVHLLFGSDGDNLTAFFGWDNGKLERYIRYCCARFGGFDVCWEGRAEYEEQRESPPGAAALANHIGRWVERYDPCGHLQSMHTTGSNRELASERWLDWVMHQAQRWDWVLQDRSYGKPVMNEEFYYEDSGAGRTHRHHSDADTVRRWAWKLMTAGASGLAYGNTGTLHARAMPFRGAQYLHSEGAQAMTALYEFWSRLEFWDLAPAESPGPPGLVSCPGREYVAYVEDRAPRTLALGPGRYLYQWYDPRAGSWLGAPRPVSDLGDPPVFVAPEQGDWVLHIRRAGREP